MSNKDFYDVVIIGGGLAGLTLAISLAKEGKTIALIEKEVYPFHKVCGEYISLESWDFLLRCDVPLKELNLPIIQQLKITAPNGKELNASLPLGGFGISRFSLDNTLKDIAINTGVSVFEKTKALNVEFVKDKFVVETNSGLFNATLVCGSFGKRTNLDVKWKRPFVEATKNRLNQFIAVKYHISYNGNKDEIALHNFEDGYCGMSQIEDGKFCLCYLTTASNLQKSNNDVGTMEKQILSKNPYLKKIFTESTKLYDAPLVISQISFDKKTQVDDHILFIGDAAGLITPLCGNGMSMAMHGSHIAAQLIIKFLNKEITRNELEKNYQNKWNTTFAKRLLWGRMIQRLFGKTFTTNLLIGLLKRFPFLVGKIVNQTHGKPF